MMRISLIGKPETYFRLDGPDSRDVKSAKKNNERFEKRRSKTLSLNRRATIFQGDLQRQKRNIKKDDFNEVQKTRQIGEILGILEETHRSKNWILQEIRKNEIKVNTKPAMNGYEMLSCCPANLVAELLHRLKGDDIQNLEETRIKTYHWFFTDIVAGSNPSIPTKAQVGKIMALNNLISQTDTFQKRDSSSTIILPTGDGMAIGFGDSPHRPVQLAIELHKVLRGYNESKRGKDKLLIRVGLESGPIFFVKDLEGKENVWGRGILMTRRVMDLTGDMQIFASTGISEELARISPQYQSLLHPVQSYETKYGEKIQLYNVYGDGFGNKTAPVKQKKLTTRMHRGIKSATNFSFREIQILLDVIDVKTMQTHHTWIWNIVNISKEPKSKILYHLDGPVPKDFADLNVSVTNEDGEKLDIVNVSVDKPYHKEFYVGLKSPALPKQQKKLKLQYDWEEPERTFLYRFPSGAKKFNYICTVPKEIELKSRVLKVDIGTGYKVHATPPATIKRLDDKTVISWSKSNIIPQDAYQFDW